MRRLRHLTGQHRTASTNGLPGATHMSGAIPDIGVEMGKMFDWNHTARPTRACAPTA